MAKGAIGASKVKYFFRSLLLLFHTPGVRGWVYCKTLLHIYLKILLRVEVNYRASFTVARPHLLLDKGF